MFLLNDIKIFFINIFKTKMNSKPKNGIGNSKPTIENIAYSRVYESGTFESNPYTEGKGPFSTISSGYWGKGRHDVRKDGYL